MRLPKGRDATGLGVVPATRQVIAGAGLTGGGALSANVTLNVVAADGSIVVGANDITVGLVTPAKGGTGVVNGSSNTITFTGNYTLGLTLSAATSVTLPTTGTLATLAGTETLSSKTLTAPKFINGGFIADANGNELLIFTTTASAVNELTLANAAAGGNVSFSATGSDADIIIELNPKGAGWVESQSYNIAGGYSSPAWGTFGIALNVEAATYTDTSSSGTVAVANGNSFIRPTFAASSSTTFTNAATVYVQNTPVAGSNVSLTNPWAIWVDAGDVRLDGNLHFFTSGNGINDANKNELVKFTTTASAVNEFTVANAATGAGPTLSSTGGDTDVDMNYTTKGAGIHVFTAGVSTPIRARASTSSSYLQIYTGTTTLRSQIGYNSSSASTVVMVPSSTKIVHSFVTTNAAATVNYLESESVVTGSRAKLSAKGSDTNVGLELAVQAAEAVYLNGGMKNKYVAKTGTYSIVLSDYCIECTANTFTVTLPTAVGITGQIFVVMNSGSGTITLATTSSQTIDGSTTQSLAQYESFMVMSNGANWIVI